MTKAYYVTNTLILDIRPCPFCGSTRLTTMTTVSDNNHRVRCEDCRAMGPLSEIVESRDEDAIIEWNKRGEKQ